MTVEPTRPVSGRCDFECGLTLGDWKIEFPSTGTAEETVRWEVKNWDDSTKADLVWMSCTLFDADDNEVDYFRLDL